MIPPAAGAPTKPRGARRQAAERGAEKPMAAEGAFPQKREAARRARSANRESRPRGRAPLRPQSQGDAGRIGRRRGLDLMRPQHGRQQAGENTGPSAPARGRPSSKLSPRHPRRRRRRARNPARQIIGGRLGSGRARRAGSARRAAAGAEQESTSQPAELVGRAPCRPGGGVVARGLRSCPWADPPVVGAGGRAPARTRFAGRWRRADPGRLSPRAIGG